MAAVMVLGAVHLKRKMVVIYVPWGLELALHVAHLV